MAKRISPKAEGANHVRRRTHEMYRVMIISKDADFLAQANTYLCRMNADIRVVTLNDPSKIDEALETSLSVDGFVCDHNPPKIDAFAIFQERVRKKDFRPFIISIPQENEKVISKAYELKIDYVVVRDRPVMNLYLDFTSKIIVAVEGWRIKKERELNERRLKTLVRVAGMHNFTFHEILYFVLEEAVVLTDSKMGYVALYEEESGIVTMQAWSHGGLEACKTKDRPLNYKLDEMGIWGEPIRLRQTILVNDYSREISKAKKGTPMGHVPLNRLMMIPLMHNGKVVGTAGVANKVGEYNLSDQNQFVLLMDGLVSIHYERLLQRRAQATEQKLRDVLDYAPVGIVVLNKALNVLECNAFAKEIIDSSQMDNGGGPPDMWNNNFFKTISDMSRSVSVSAKENIREIRVGKDFLARDVRVMLSPTSTPDKEDSGYIVITEDITMQKKTSGMLEGVLHHINILDQKIYSSMSEQTEILQNAVANVKTSPEVSIKSAARAISEIREMIDFVKVYRTVGILDPEWQNLSDVVSRALGNFNTMPVETVIKVDGIRVLADASFHRAFFNLISNSLKHGKKVTRIRIGYRISKGNLTIVYEDDGVGIPKEQKGKLFSGVITETERLGLFMISSVVSVSGMTIKEVGIPGEGAVFEMCVSPSNYAIY